MAKKASHLKKYQFTKKTAKGATPAMLSKKSKLGVKKTGRRGK